MHKSPREKRKSLQSDIRSAGSNDGHTNTPNANMADQSVIARDELHESEASEASVFCFDKASTEKSCFVDGLLCFISLCLLFFVFLNASRRARNFPTSASTGK